MNALVLGLLILLQLSSTAGKVNVRLNINGKEISYTTEYTPGTPEFDKEKKEKLMEAIGGDNVQITPKPGPPNPGPTPPTPTKQVFKMNGGARTAAVDIHNHYRSFIALGRANHAKRGKNIYKLSYDMELEKQAQEWANACIWEHSDKKKRKAGENLHHRSNYKLRSSADLIKKAAASWWSELERFGVKNYTFQQGMNDIGHWTLMAWDDTTTIGCGVNLCNFDDEERHFVVCHYRPTGNIIGKQIYEEGEGCGCTLYPGSSCEQNTMLCVKP